MGNLKSCLSSSASTKATVDKSELPQPISASVPSQQTKAKMDTSESPQPTSASVPSQRTEAKMDTSESPQPSPASVPSQQQPAKCQYDPELLKLHHVGLVDDLNDVVLAFIMPLLASDEKEAIDAKENPREKYQTLLDVLYRSAETGIYEKFNTFMQCISAILPELFQQVVGRSPPTLPTSELRDLIKTAGPMEDETDLYYANVQLDMLGEGIGSLYPVEKKGFSRVWQSIDQFRSWTPPKRGRVESISLLDVLNDGAEGVERLTQPLKDSQKILICGRTGIGKTSLLRWLAYQWACLKWAPTFSVIFVIDLHSLSLVDDQITAIELLTTHALHHLTDSGCDIASVLLEYLSNKILIMVDNVDEIEEIGDRIKSGRKVTNAHEKAHPIEIILSILSGDLLSGCSVVSTSRPFVQLQNLPVSKTYEIIGLTHHRLNEFVECKHPSKAKQIMSTLNESNLLKSICSGPFYGTVVTKLLNGGHSINEDDLMTYTRFTAFIAMRVLSEKLDVEKSFMKLAKMAYSGLFESTKEMSKIAFNHIDLEKHQISEGELDFLVKCGIIKVYPGMKRNSVIFKFLHLSLQELLAAAYMVSLPMVPESVLDVLFKSSQIHMTINFMFGLMFDTKHPTIHQFYKAVQPSGEVQDSVKIQLKEKCLHHCYDRMDSLMKFKYCQIVVESQNDESFAQKMAHYVVPTRMLDIDKYEISPLNIAAIDYVCRFSKSPIHHISVRAADMGDDMLEVMLSTMLKRHAADVQFLTFTHERIGDEGVILLAKAMKDYPTFEALDLSNNQIGAKGMAAMCGPLEHSPHFRYLAVMNNHFGPEGIRVMNPGLIVSTHLKVLDVGNNQIGDEGVRILCEVHKVNQKIDTYMLQYNEITNKGASYLADMLRVPGCNMKTLNVRDNNIKDEGILDLCDAYWDYKIFDSFQCGTNAFTREGPAEKMLYKLVKHRSPKYITFV